MSNSATQQGGSGSNQNATLAYARNPQGALRRNRHNVLLGVSGWTVGQYCVEGQHTGRAQDAVIQVYNQTQSIDNTKESISSCVSCCTDGAECALTATPHGPQPLTKVLTALSDAALSRLKGSDHVCANCMA